jgi:DNA-binding NtrC family response regulator
LQRPVPSEFELSEIIGESPELKSVLSQAINAAKSDAVVVITGESGTGKELIARAIHHTSSRRLQSFIKLDCSSITPAQLDAALFGPDKNRLEAANLGTLLLKRVESVSQDLQSKLLRVLEEKKFEIPRGTTVPINARLITTMSDIGQKAEDSWLCTTLSSKLSPCIIRVPALRERQSDIPLLAWYFVKMWTRRMNKSIDVISPETMKSFVNYSWPDNVRELDNFIERSVRSTKDAELLSKISMERAERADGERKFR